MLKKLFCILLSSTLTLSAYSTSTLVDSTMREAKIRKTIEKLAAGDTLFFASGTYTCHFNLKNIHGEFNNPIVIKGLSNDKGNNPHFISSFAPDIKAKNYAFHLRDCSWIEIRDLNFSNYFIDAVKADESSYISLSSCKVKGSKRVLFAEGRNSHHFLIENCSWEQDEKVWTHTGDYSWDEIHHGKYRYFNGSIFQGSKISGNFVLRNNTIKNTFNAFRLSQIGQGNLDSLAGTNGEIYSNTIINTADNVLEPELFCYNLHFYHNHIINGHAFISITEVGGGYLYLYGNTGISMPESEDGWTIYKISKRTLGFSFPSWFFNNSWYIDFDVLGSPRNEWKEDYIHHFNNAYFIEKSDSFGVYNIGKDNSYDYNCSNKPFPKWFLDQGFEKNSLVKNPEFQNPLKNNFRLKCTSPCKDAGKIDSVLIPFYSGERPDIGAWEQDELVFGMPFRYKEPLVPVPYKESPRITRYKISGKEISLWFSLPMNFSTLRNTNISLQCSSGILPLTLKKETTGSYQAVFSLSREIGDIQKIFFSQWPMAKTGTPLTIWGSAVPVSSIKN